MRTIIKSVVTNKIIDIIDEVEVSRMGKSAYGGPKRIFKIKNDDREKVIYRRDPQDVGIG